MSLGLVVLEKKLFTRTRTYTLQSDDIMSADGKNIIFCEGNNVGCSYPMLTHQKGYVVHSVKSIKQSARGIFKVDRRN